MGEIYLLENRINGKGYVGKTQKGVEARWRTHLRNARLGRMSRLYSAIRKHGAAAFDLRILACIDDAATLSLLERLWILVLDTVRTGYNMTSGGDGGVVPGTGGWNKGKKTPASVVAKTADKNRGMKRHSTKLSQCSRAIIARVNASRTPEERSEYGRKARAAVQNPVYVTANLRPGLQGFTPEQRSEIVKKGHATRRARLLEMV